MGVGIFLWLKPNAFVPVLSRSSHKNNISVTLISRLTPSSVDSKTLGNNDRQGISPSTVYVSSPNVKSELKYKDKHLFYGFAEPYS